MKKIYWYKNLSLHYPFAFAYFCFGIGVTLFFLVNGTILYSGLSKLTGTMNRTASIISTLYIFSVIHCIIISGYWINMRNKEIAIRKAFGWSNRMIILLIMRELFQLAVCSFIIFSLAENLFLHYLNVFLKENYHITIQNLYQMTLQDKVFILKIFFITIAMTVILPICKIIKNLPIKYLK